MWILKRLFLILVVAAILLLWVFNAAEKGAEMWLAQRVEAARRHRARLRRAANRDDPPADGVDR